jgi:hypothetical protein
VAANNEYVVWAAMFVRPWHLPLTNTLGKFLILSLLQR